MQAPSLDTIQPSQLLAPLGHLFDRPDVQLLHWQGEPIKGGAGNPTTVGLRRVQGQVLVNHEQRPFSLVLKAVQSPANVGYSGFGEDEQHWNYWQRERLFFQSDLQHRLPAGVIAPACYAIQEWDGQIVWLWLEEIEPGLGDITRPEQLAFVARQLGRLNGTFARPEDLPGASWLGRNTHAQWLVPPQGMPTPLLAPDYRPYWDHPVMQAMFPPSSPNPYRQFRDDVDHFLQVLATLPPTWCHGDADATNFRIRRTAAGSEEVVALDWALTCLGVLGQDVAHLIYGSFQHFAPSEWDGLIRLLLDGYLAGLRDTGWSGDERDVWLGCGITILIKFGTFMLVMTGMDLSEHTEPAQVAAAKRLPVDFLQQIAQGMLELYEEFGKRARSL